MDIQWSVPLSESTLREVAKNVDKYIPPSYFADIDNRVKDIHLVGEALLGTAGLVNISPTQRADACNILCLLLERCASSPVESLRAQLWERAFWMRLFDIYLERAHNAKAKSMRQVVAALTTVLTKSPSISPTRELKLSALVKLFSLIQDQHDAVNAKQALQALSIFLSKQLYNFEEVIELFQGYDETRPTSQIGALQILVKHCFHWVTIKETASVASHLISTISEKGKDFRKSSLPALSTYDAPFWVLPLRESFNEAPQAVQNFKHYVFPAIFKADLLGFVSFLIHLGIEEHISPSCNTGSGEEQPETCSTSEKRNLTLLLAAVQTAKEIGIVLGTETNWPSRIAANEGVVYIPDLFLGRLLAHESPFVRTAALSALTASGSRPRPITSTVFRYLRSNMFHFHAETESSCRNEILGVIQRVLDRIKATCASVWKRLPKTPKASDNLENDGALIQHYKHEHVTELESLRQHQEFLLWYIRFLALELRPGASYQRHIMALRVLTVLLRSGLDPHIAHEGLSKQAKEQNIWPFHLVVVTECTFRTLLDLIMDPFHDVRDSAAQIMKLIIDCDTSRSNAFTTIHSQGSQSKFSACPYLTYARSSLPLVLDRLEKLTLHTSRTEHADGFSHVCSVVFYGWKVIGDFPSIKIRSGLLQQCSTDIDLLKVLIHKVESATALSKSDLAQAVEKFPIYGYLTSIRRILEDSTLYPRLRAKDVDLAEWRAIHARIFLALEDVWQAVRTMLCDDAPEGYFPDDFDEEVDLTTKDVLSFSWRALKEASILARVIIANGPFHVDADRSLLLERDFQTVGDLCFAQLSELRHRGAFSTVAQTFGSCCERCSSIEHPAIRTLPEAWYQQTLVCIREQASVLTRRSAGLPSLLIAIAIAEPGGNLMKALFKDIFGEAEKDVVNSLCGRPDRLPQVHAMNSLTALLTNSRLASVSEPFIAKALTLAAGRLDSDIWAVRNAGLMLFRSLIDRIIGSSDKGHLSKEESTNFPRKSLGQHSELLNLIIKLLDMNTFSEAAVGKSSSSGTEPGRATESVIPALQILHWIHPPQSHVPILRRLTLRLSGHSHWHIRDMAARTIPALFSTEGAEAIRSILDPLLTGQNALHGRLLAVKYLLKYEINSLSASTLSSLDGNDAQRFLNLQSIFSNVSRHFSIVFETNHCQITKASLLDIVNEFGKLNIVYPELGVSYEAFAAPILTQARRWVDEYNEGTNFDASIRWPVLCDTIAIYLTILLVLAECESRSLQAIPAESRPLWTHLISMNLDTCCAVLETLDQIAVKLTSLDSRNAVFRIAVEVAGVISDNSNQCRALLIATKILDSSNLGRHGFTDDLYTTNIARAIDNSGPGTDTSPSLSNSLLKIQAIQLDAQLPLRISDHDDTLAKFKCFLARLRASIGHSNPYDTRYAAAVSLHHFRQLWLHGRSLVEISTIFVQACMLVYDILNDDDDEIRDIGAKVATRICAGDHLCPPREEFLPLVASQRLSKNLTVLCHARSDFCHEAIRRLTGNRVCPGRQSYPVQKVLMEAQSEDSATFLIEKRNLFIDDVREAFIWSRVLKRISSEAITQEAARILTEWVMEGLAVLSKKATAGCDGPLGWSSNGQVFILGMQLIYGAEVLMRWRARSRKVLIPGYKIRRALLELMDNGLHHNLHNLWIVIIEKILANWVAKQLIVARTMLFKECVDWKGSSSVRTRRSALCRLADDIRGALYGQSGRVLDFRLVFNNLALKDTIKTKHS